MWRNYLIVGLRALAKNRVYAAINIIGLAVGIAACLLILSYVRYEFSYDAWLPNADRTYEFQTIFRASEAGQKDNYSQTTAYVAGQALKKDFPQIENLIWYSNPPATVLRDGQPLSVDNAVITDGPFFRVIEAPFVKGDPAHALDDPHAVVLSEKEAKREFGSADPVGQTITIASGDQTADYRVTGIFKDLPHDSNIQADMVMRIVPTEYYRNYPDMVNSYHWQSGSVFVKLRPGADAAAINAELPQWEKRNIPDDVGAVPKRNPGDTEDWRLQNIRDIHLSGTTGMAVTTDQKTVLTFALIGLLILGIACINFTNLATARAAQRAREVALRKVLGATRRQLIMQFLGESVLLTGIATLIALAIAELMLRPMNAFLDAQITMPYLGLHGILLPVLAMVVIVGLAGGLYPAFYLSRFEPARVLKANKSAADVEGGGRLRAILVVAQFAVSIGLIICTGIIYAQTSYARADSTGYQREGLLQANGLFNPGVDQGMDGLLNELRATPSVSAVGRVVEGFNPGNNSDTDARLPGQIKGVDLGTYALDTGAIAAIGTKLLAGRNFSDAVALDDASLPNPPDPAAQTALVQRGTNVILSQLAAAKLGFKTPQDAIGKHIEVAMVDSQYGFVPATVIGVIEDVRYRGVRGNIQPIFYFHTKTGYNNMLVRFVGNPAQMRQTVEQIWRKHIPNVPFDGHFVTDVMHDMYNRDQTRAQLFGGFSILAVIIGCLGLFGLAAFTAERRTKEIGIRKVLGARTRDIVRLLVWQFSRPVLIANVIAWPIAWWLMRDWLNGFDHRIALTPMPFIEAGLIALVIAIVTIGAHAWRVAQTSPIRALRYE